MASIEGKRLLFFFFLCVVCVRCVIEKSGGGGERKVHGVKGEGVRRRMMYRCVSAVQDKRV